MKEGILYSTVQGKIRKGTPLTGKLLYTAGMYGMYMETSLHGMLSIHLPLYIR
jgi:hypothetical protein